MNIIQKLMRFRVSHIPLYISNVLHRVRKIFNIPVYERLYRLMLVLPPRYAISRKRHSGPRIIVSFTTFPARYNAIPVVLKSLAYQSMKADKIVLYLSKEQCRDVPPILKNLYKYGLEVKIADGDMRSHKKYLYAMTEYPDDIIVTIDDDLVYPPNMIKSLYLSYQRFPNCVSALMVTEIGKNEDGSLKKYVEWEVALNMKYCPSNTLIAMTGAGALYPPHLLCRDTFDTDKIKALCFTADDIWMKFMELKSGVQVVHAIKQQTESETLNYIGQFYEGGLYVENCEQGKNDVCVQNMINLTGIKPCDIR